MQIGTHAYFHLSIFCLATKTEIGEKTKEVPIWLVGLLDVIFWFRPSGREDESRKICRRFGTISYDAMVLTYSPRPFIPAWSLFASEVRCTT